MVNQNDLLQQILEELRQFFHSSKAVKPPEQAQVIPPQPIRTAETAKPPEPPKPVPPKVAVAAPPKFKKVPPAPPKKPPIAVGHKIIKRKR